MKIIKLIIILFMLISVLSACGRNNDAAQAVPVIAGVPQTSEAIAPQVRAGYETEATEVVLFTWWDGAEQEFGRALIADFEAVNSDIKVRQNFIPFSGYISTVNTMFAAGDTPDVFLAPGFRVIEWGEEGIGQDLTPHFNETGIDPHIKWIDTALYTSGENIWGISPALITTVLFYNRELFAASGVASPLNNAAKPWSWDEFVQAARILTVDMAGLSPGDTGFDYDNVRQWGTVMPNSWIYVMSLLYAAETGIANDTGTRLLINQPDAIKALQNMADLAHVHRSAPTFALTETDVLGNLPALLMERRLAMFIGATSLHSDFANENFNVGVAQIPSMSGVGNNMVLSAGYMLRADAEEQGFRLLMHISDFNNWVNTSRETNLALTWLPQTNSVFDDPELNAAWVKEFDQVLADVAGDILQNGSRVGENTTLRNFGIIMDQHLIPLFNRIWLGEVSAAYGMAEIEPVLRNLLAGAW